MAIETMSLIIFCIFLMSLCIFMYFKISDDMWFQMLWTILGFVTFIFFLIFVYYTSNVGMNYPLEFDRVYISDANINSNNISQEVINQQNTTHLFQFRNLRHIEENLFQKADFCFKYNNSDGGNAIQITNSINAISEVFYLPNTTYGQTCVNINISAVKDSNYLGINCIDCQASNVLYHLVDNNGININKVEINKTNALIYTVSNAKPDIWWLEVRSPPYRSLNTFFYSFLFVLGFFVLGFGIRAIIMLIVKLGD